MTRANELATKRRRFTAECKARVAMEALRGDRTIQTNRGQAPKCIRTKPAVRSAKPGIGWVHSLVVVASGSLQVGLIDLLPGDEGSRRSKSSQKRRRFTEARGWSMSLPPRPDHAAPFHPRGDYVLARTLPPSSGCWHWCALRGTTGRLERHGTPRSSTPIWNQYRGHAPPGGAERALPDGTVAGVVGQCICRGPWRSMD